MNNNRNKDSGITLIALVITIIVLIILAGVSIAMLTGDNGLLKKVEEARINNDKAELREYQELLNAELKIDEYIRNENLTQDETIARIARNLGVGEENITGNLIRSSDGKYGIMVKDDNSIEVAKYEDAYVSANYIDPTDVSEFIWQELDDGTIWVTEYIGTAKSINIPDTIEGKRVSKIGGNKYWQSSIAMEFDNNGNATFNPNNTVSENVGPVIRNKGVKSIKFPSGVNRITSDAFSQIELEETFFSDGPEIIDFHSFFGNNIKRLKLPTNLKYIGDHGFEKNLLEKVEFNNKLEYISGWAFADNYLKQINLPDSVNTMLDGAFTKNNDEKILYTIKNGVEDKTYINSYCGRNAGNIVIPTGVKTIGSQAFYEVGLNSIVIPETVKAMGVFSIRESNKRVESVIVKGKPKLSLFSFSIMDVGVLELSYEDLSKASTLEAYILKADKVVAPYSEDGSIIENYRNNISKYVKEYGSIEEKSN